MPEKDCPASGKKESAKLKKLCLPPELKDHAKPLLYFSQGQGESSANWGVVRAKVLEAGVKGLKFTTCSPLAIKWNTAATICFRADGILFLQKISITNFEDSTPPAYTASFCGFGSFSTPALD